MLDTGAEISILKNVESEKPVFCTCIHARGVTGQPLPISGVQQIKGDLEGMEIDHEFIIAELDMPWDGIAGIDLLHRYDAHIDVREGAIFKKKRVLHRYVSRLIQP